MTNEENKEYMQAQIKKIEEFKWLESEKVGYDLGEQAVIQWIKEHAAEFRAEWKKNKEM